MDPAEPLRALRACWSVETGGHWLPDNPARGQCNVTALVVQGLLGGETLRTDTPGGWHFYNRIDGARRDFTESRFAEPPAYRDVLSSREEALSGTTLEQYGRLSERVRRQLRAGGPRRGA